MSKINPFLYLIWFVGIAYFFDSFSYITYFPFTMFFLIIFVKLNHLMAMTFSNVWLYNCVSEIQLITKLYEPLLNLI